MRVVPVPGRHLFAVLVLGGFLGRVLLVVVGVVNVLLFDVAVNGRPRADHGRLAVLDRLLLVLFVLVVLLVFLVVLVIEDNAVLVLVVEVDLLVVVGGHVVNFGVFRKFFQLDET